MTPMQFIGLTAGIDAGLSLAAWLIVSSRRRRIEQEGGLASRTANYFSKYLVYSFVFLALTAVAMLSLTGPTQEVVVMISDIALWVSLVYMVMLVSVGRSTGPRNAAIAALLVFAVAGSLYQVASFYRVELTFGPSVTYVLTQIAPLLMYAVWVPSALLFFMAAMRTSQAFVRVRSLMFGAGLLLITFSWAFRLLSIAPSFAVVAITSVIGFALLLGGVLYKRA